MLIGLKKIMRLSGVSYQQTMKLTQKPSFPNAIISPKGFAMWNEDEVQEFFLKKLIKSKGGKQK